MNVDCAVGAVFTTLQTKCTNVAFLQVKLANSTGILKVAATVVRRFNIATKILLPWVYRYCVARGLFDLRLSRVDRLIGIGLSGEGLWRRLILRRIAGQWFGVSIRLGICRGIRRSRRSRDVGICAESIGTTALRGEPYRKVSARQST